MTETGRSGPLVGVTVLELGSTVAAPFCGRLLADFGARVIKVEPFEGDVVRTMGEHKAGQSLYATSILRNKDLVAVNINTSAGVDLIKQMAAKCDIVVENFRPGKLEEWGLGYDVLSKDNTGLIMVRLSGYGQTGPYRDRPGYGVTCEAVSGLRELTGNPESPPSRVAVSLTDQIAALYGAFGAMLALFDRQRSGKGQVIDVALYEAAFSMTEPHVPAHSALGVIPTRAGSRLPGTAPNNLYRSRDGRYIHITAISSSLFRRLLDVINRPELAEDPRFATNDARSRNGDALDEIIAAWTESLPFDELEHRLIDAGIPAARIYNMADIFADPHFRFREMLVGFQDPELGAIAVPGIVPKLSGTPGSIYKYGGSVGKDTQSVLKDVLGLSESDIERLQAEDAISIVS